MDLPPRLLRIIALFEDLPEPQRRENLVAYAESASNYAPEGTFAYTIKDIRRDEECLDTVGLYLRVYQGDAGQECVQFRIELGKHVQTLTKAMGAILCEGLEGAELKKVLELDSQFVKRIVGGELIRVRSQTVYYVLSRMQGICKAYLAELQTKKS